MSAGAPNAGAANAEAAGARALTFRRGLLGLVALGAVSQALIQSQAYSINPMALVPQSDAATIWRQAGEIANGQLVAEAPYDTAPLILWVVAFLRAWGGGLAAWGVLQSILHVTTALLIAATTRAVARSLSSSGASSVGSQATGAGLLAGALYLLLDEPAASTSRVLSGTIQLFLAAALLFVLRPGIDEEGSDSRGLRPALAGLLLGLLCTAYPPMLLGLALFGAWMFWRRGGGAALGLVGMAALAIAPATLHNLKATGELIPISAQAGLTFYHGNNAEADGTIAPVGVVNNKDEQAADSLRQARAALGESAGWKDASTYWRDQGLAWWGAHPARGVRLAFTKLWFAFSGQRYGDVYQPWRERDAGAASRLWLAPLPLAWLMPLALVALLWLLALRARRAAILPYAILFGVPVVTVVLFFYTPRYRLPSAVAVVPLASLALAMLAGRGGVRPASETPGQRRPWIVIALGSAALLGVLSGPLNRAISFDVDRSGSHEARFLERMAAASGQIDRHGDGARYLLGLLRLDPDNGETRGRLLDLAWLLAASPDPSVREPDAALEVAGSLIDSFGPAPGLLDLRGTARAATGDFQGALADVTAALSGLAPADPARAEIELRRQLFSSDRVFELVPPTD